MSGFKKVILQGTTDAGGITSIPVTAEGHLEMAIHGPTNSFGSVHSESLTAEFQTDSVYGLNLQQVNAVVGHLTGGVSSATNSGSNNLFTCATGTTPLSFATIQSRRRLRYRAGQGITCRFNAIFSEPATDSILVAGVGTGESGLFFGYNGTSFGILHSTGGVREIQTLTVSAPSTATNDYVITLAGTAFTVTATNNASTIKTAYEISQGTYAGWKVVARGSTVVFLANDVGNKSGVMSLAQTGAGVPASGSFVETLPGVASTDTWTPQENWNGDKLDGTGASGITLNPQNGNNHQINIAYGFGSIDFMIEVTGASSNATFAIVHTLDFPNAGQVVNISQPSFPFTMSAYSAGSSTNVYVSNASFAGFIEGKKQLNGPRLTYVRESSGFVSSAASTYYPMFTIRNDIAHSHGITERANQSVVNLLSFSCSHDDATPVTFFLIRNATLTGTPNFTRYASSSCTYVDTSATTCTVGSNDQLVFSLNTGQNSGATIVLDDEILLQPGETITLAARAVTGTASFVNVSLNTREDQ